eukprot:TRINITY_DN920_c0_g4_i2.p1 TRINITY_DN920_c0_g4~~TRINITY_DN920_c0_g4_i2.p1  ORF type:complete len:196 (-),score=50.84 TRINITY_DN920_c0_g4_i2:159-746(-)
MTSEEEKEVSSLVEPDVWSNRESLPPNEIQEFWFEAMRQNATLAEEITPADEGPLSVLSCIKLRRYKESKNFDLVFEFKPNEYFEETQVIKSFILAREGDPIETKCTPMSWKQGKRQAKSAKESFFDFFSGCAPKAEEKDSKVYNKLVNKLYHDFEIGVVFRDEVIPSLVDFYLGLVEQYDEESVEEEVSEDERN